MSTRKAYLGLGSNMGDRQAFLQFAVDGLAAAGAGKVTAVSPVYESEPVGGPEQPDYLNAVVVLETEMPARELLGIAKQIERDSGRDMAGVRWGPRTLDVDILMIPPEVVEELDLVLPHPRMHQRAFVLAPLSDLVPWMVVAPAAGWQGVHRTSLELRLPE